MNLNALPFFPYPRDPATRLGFAIGDLISLGVLLLIFLPTVKAVGGF